MELIITLAVFFIFVTSVINIFASAIKYQRKIGLLADLLNGSSYATEYMSRAIRMAQKDLFGVCIAPKDNFLLISSNRIMFLNYNSECQEFYLDNGAIWASKQGIAQPLTASSINITDLEFAISGQSQLDDLQPKVTFAFSLETRENEPKQINLQSSVSQRQLDVPY